MNFQYGAHAKNDACHVTVNPTSELIGASIGENAPFKIQFPEHVEATELEFQQSEVEGSQPSLHWGEAALQLSEMGISQKVDTVLYPFSGYDAMTPTVLFPHASSIVTLDLGPFVKDTNAVVIPKYGEAETGGTFHTTGQSMETDSVASNLIARLMVNIRNVRILKVTAFTDSLKTVFDKPAVHGVIEFDTGPGTPLRTYTHLNIDLQEEPVDSPWLEQLKVRGIDALVLKGATGGLSVHNDDLDKETFRMVSENQGVIIDGDGNYTQSLFHDPQHYDFNGTFESHRLKGFEGYAGGVVYQFHSPKE